MADDNEHSQVDIVERIPWSWERQSGHQRPRWRLLRWRVVGGVLSSLDEVLERSSLSRLVEYARWATRPTAVQVREAVATLGVKNVDGSRAGCIDRDPHWRLTIEDGMIRVMDRSMGTAMCWSGKGWEPASAGWYAHT